MKKQFITQALCVFAILCFCASVSAQTIRRCNNNPGVTGVNMYTTLQAAHDAAVTGDIIYLDPSDNSYGPVDIRKRLTIIGNGYFNDKNTNNGFYSRTSKISTITFNNGSANSILTGIDQSGGMTIADLNITIARCKLANNMSFGVSSNLVAGQYSRGNNGTITKCILLGNISGSNSMTVASQYGYNCAITNNISQGAIGSMTNTTISNNTFNATYQGSGNTALLFGCSVTNNIYDARGMSGTINFVGAGSGNTISNNICLAANASPTGNGNLVFGDETITYIVSNPWPVFGSEDSKFQLAASGSPAAGIGAGGTNAGAFGGSNPYILAGQPAYPIITNYLVSGVGNASAPLNVSITVRGNN